MVEGRLRVVIYCTRIHPCRCGWALDRAFKMQPAGQADGLHLPRMLALWQSHVLLWANDGCGALVCAVCSTAVHRRGPHIHKSPAGHILLDCPSLVWLALQAAPPVQGGGLMQRGYSNAAPPSGHAISTRFTPCPPLVRPPPPFRQPARPTALLGCLQNDSEY
eukprot:359072-Chlamydomonas_euryale.AAC.2